jgi:hypothetical protein
MKTRRQVLIEAGVPSEELDKVTGDHNVLDDGAGSVSPREVLWVAFIWGKSPQKHDFWYKVAQSLPSVPPVLPPGSTDESAQTEKLPDCVEEWLDENRIPSYPGILSFKADKLRAFLSKYNQHPDAKHFPGCPVIAKERIAELEKQLHEAGDLLESADCPQCKDKSGAYYANDGDVCQCQWCHEVAQLFQSIENAEDE